MPIREHGQSIFKHIVCGTLCLRCGVSQHDHGRRRINEVFFSTILPDKMRVR